MNKEDYKLYTWQPLTDDEYWVDTDYQNEFPNCQTIVCDTIQDNMNNHIMTYDDCHLGWGTMAKAETYMFMIVEKPKNKRN